MQDLDQESLRAWLRQMLAKRPRGTSAKLAKHLGVSPDAVTRMSSVRSGKEVRGIKADELAKMVAFFGEAPAGQINPAPKEDATPSSARFVLARVIGKVEAGAFRVVDEFDQDAPETILVPRDERFPQARQWVFDVNGDSMNALPGTPLPNGSYAVCIAYEDVAHLYPLRDGMTVVVERRADGGHLRERSVKQLQIYEDRVEFWPRSTNASHKPIVVERKAFDTGDTEVEIIGLVRYGIGKIDYL